MASLRQAGALAAGGTIVNVLAGENLEFVGQRPAAVKIFAVQDGVGPTELVMEVTFGNSVSGRSIVVPVFTANQGPNVDQHEVNAGVAMPGDRIQIKLQNLAAAATANWRILTVVDPVLM